MAWEQAIPYLMEAGTVCFEVFIVYFYMEHIFLKKQVSLSFFLSVICATAAAFMLKTLVPIPVYVNLCLSCLIFFCLSCLLFQGKIRHKVYAMILYCIIIILADMATMGILSRLMGIPPSQVPAGYPARGMGMMLSVFINFILSAVTGMLFWSKYKKLPLGHWVFMVLCPLFSLGILVLIDQLMIMGESTSYLFMVLPVLGLIYINVAVFNFFDTYHSQMRLGIMEEIFQRNSENYRLLQATETEIRILRHDIKNHIRTVNGFLEGKEPEEARQYMKSLSRKFEQVPDVIYTQNEALDAILNSKNRQAGNLGMHLQIESQIFDVLKIDPVVLNLILNPVLDSAIKCCASCGERKISVCAQSKDNNILCLKIKGRQTEQQADADILEKDLKHVVGIVRELGGSFLQKIEENGCFAWEIMLNGKI